MTGLESGSGSETGFPVPVSIFLPRFRSEPDRGQAYIKGKDERDETDIKQQLEEVESWV